MGMATRQDGGTSDEWEFKPNAVLREKHPAHSPIDGERRNPKEYRIKYRLRDEAEGKRFYHVEKHTGGGHLYSCKVLEGQYEQVTLEESEHFGDD